MVGEFGSSGEEGRFNMGIATLQRIHQLLTATHESSLGVSQLAEPNSSEQKRLQLMTLDRIYLEVKPYLRSDEVEKISAKRGDLDQKFGSTPEKEWSKLYGPLLEYETLLRETHYFKQMLMPRSDDAEMAFRG